MKKNVTDRNEVAFIMILRVCPSPFLKMKPFTL